MKNVSGILAGACVAMAVAGEARGDYLLWSDNANFGAAGNTFGDIQRANLDGTDQSTLVTGLVGPNQIAADLSDGRIYWVDGRADNNTGDIRRANLDGSSQQTVVPNQYFPIGMALDASAGQMYWIAHPLQTDGSNLFGKDIRRANLDGTSPQTLVHTLNVTGNGQLALDLAGGKIYTTDYNENRIRRFNLDGSGETTVISSANGPIGIALDIPDGKIYWADNGTNSIMQANLDGTRPHTVLNNLLSPSGLTLDLSAGKMYWTDYGDNGVADGQIQSANLDGSNPQTLVTGLNGPFAITLVPEPSSAGGLLGCCAAPWLRTRRRRRR
jgi:hypothetical protein